MKKKIVLIVLVVLVLGVFAGIYLRHWMTRPLYEPGMVRAGKNLRAPLVAVQKTDGDWQVENDIRLHHFSSGSGRHVLFVHGGPGYPFAAPRAGFQLLAGQFEFIYYDQRGCGRSTRPFDRFASSNYYQNVKQLEQTLGLGAQIADIERIRKLLGDDKLILVGHSFGALISVMYAAEFPERIAALALITPANLLLMPPAEGDLFQKVGSLLPEQLQKEYASFMSQYLEFGKLFSKSNTDLQELDRQFAKYYGMAAASRGFSFIQKSGVNGNGGWISQALYLSLGTRHDWRGAFNNVKAPVLVIHGGKDLQSEAASRVYASCFHNSQFQTLPNSGHFPFDDQPDQFAAVMEAFLRKADFSPNVE